MIHVTAIFFGFFILFLPSFSQAQISVRNDGAGGGAVKIGTSTTSCSGAVEGAIRYSSGNSVLEYCNGTSWLSLGAAAASPLYSAFTAPVDGDFSWVNQGSASVTVNSNTIYLYAPALAGDSLKIRKKTAPSTPYTITIALVPQIHRVGYSQCGLLFRESGTGKLVALTFYNDNTNALVAVSNLNSPTSWASFAVAQNSFYMQHIIWARISYDGTNMTFYWSADGRNFQQYGGNISKTAFFTTGPDEVGYFVSSSQGTYPSAATLYSWKES